MKADARCLVCHVNQALRVLNRYTRSEEEKWVKLQKIMRVIADASWGVKPIEIAEKMYPELENLIGKKDVYYNEKIRSNEMAEKILRRLEKMIREAADPLYDAAKLAIAGNLIDLGTPNWDEEMIYNKIVEVLEKPFGINDFEDFKEELRNATTVLYIADNSGEIIFDRFFIEIMKDYNPGLDVVVAAKAKPIINDVTSEDAKRIMEGVANVIDSGLTIPGTIVERASDEFRKLFFESDIVISKGQGNFEGIIEEENEKVYFLLTVKCDVVGDFLGVPPMTLVFMKNRKKR